MARKDTIMNHQDARRFRSTWEPELSISDELDSPPRTLRRARTARLGSGLTIAVVTVMAFLAGVTLGPRLHHGGPPTAVVSAGGPGPGALLGSAAPSRSVNGRHPRPEEIVRLPPQIQDQVARTVLTPAPLVNPAELLTLPWQIQDQLRQAQA